MVRPSRSRHRGRHWRRAVALVDVIVGSMLLAIAVSVFMSIASRALSAYADGEQMQHAATLVDEQLQLVLMRGPDDYGSRFPTSGTCEAPFEDYRFDLAFDGGEGGEAYTVVATISWMQGNRERQVAVETRIAPRLGDEPDPERRPAEPVSRLQ